MNVCCISSVDEATLALDAGAHALGLVSAMPSGLDPTLVQAFLQAVRLVA